MGVAKNQTARAFLDTRHLTFSPASLCSVIERSPAYANMFGLPEGAPDGVCLLPQEGRVEAVYGSGARARGFTLTLDALGALLIGYCRRARIPLPRTSRKAIEVAADKVVLMVIVELPDLPEPVLPEATSGASRRSAVEQRVSWVDPRHVWPAKA
jgi:hypothetical protein